MVKILTNAGGMKYHNVRDYLEKKTLDEIHQLKTANYGPEKKKIENKVVYSTFDHIKESVETKNLPSSQVTEYANMPKQQDPLIDDIAYKTFNQKSVFNQPIAGIETAIKPEKESIKSTIISKQRTKSAITRKPTYTTNSLLIKRLNIASTQNATSKKNKFNKSITSNFSKNDN